MMPFKVLLTESIAPEGTDLLRESVEVQVAPSPAMSDLIPLIGDADALLIRSSEVGENLMKIGKKLKVIGRHGIGLDNIDLSAASRLGIQVVNTPGANTNAVAEHAIWAILQCAKNFNRAEKAFREGKFCLSGSLPGLVHKLGFSTIELKGKTLGLIGFGRIARRLAEIARAFLMNVKSYDPLVPDDAFSSMGVRQAVSIDEAVRDADFVSLHVPYTRETHHIIGEREVALMKPQAYLINTSRGGVVDEDALCRALKCRNIAGAALDVFENEPPPLDCQFFGLDNVLVTPHMASITDLGLINMALDVSTGIIDALEGKKPKFLANPEVWERRRR
jgi:D-3-phosphoglycerate dehydrogenase